ncbi:predicted protein [Streptomyces lividans TK24]|nr:predicted protein [Streptomyces lividans TK24]
MESHVSILTTPAPVHPLLSRARDHSAPSGCPRATAGPAAPPRKAWRRPECPAARQGEAR